jgi:ribosomal protein S27E
MKHPLRENLEVYSDASNAWIRCTRCGHVLCQSTENWREFSGRRLSPPTDAGTLLKDLTGQFLLEQLYCPGCGALFNTDLVEEPKNG